MDSVMTNAGGLPAITVGDIITKKDHYKSQMTFTTPEVSNNQIHTERYGRQASKLGMQKTTYGSGPFIQVEASNVTSDVHLGKK